MGVILRDLLPRFQRHNTIRDRIAKLVNIGVWSLTHNPRDMPRDVFEQLLDGLRQSPDAAELVLEIADRLQHDEPELFDGDGE
jgi:hypothetical protein